MSYHCYLTVGVSILDAVRSAILATAWLLVCIIAIAQDWTHYKPVCLSSLLWSQFWIEFDETLQSFVAGKLKSSSLRVNIR